MPDRRLLLNVIVFILVLGAPGITGCTSANSSPQAMFDDYAERIARTLDVEVAIPEQTATVPAFPRRRERVLAVTETRLHMLDFLALYGCDLQFLVGQRNSALGRVMPSSSRWIYEMSFIDLGRRCVNQLEREAADPTLIAALEAALHAKVQQLPAVQWNAIWGSEDMERQLRRNVPALAPDFTAEHVQQVAWAVSELLFLLQAPPESFDPSRLEPALQVLATDPALARLLQSVEITTQGLNTAAAIIESRLAQGALCVRDKPTKSALILRNVFFKRYAARVQPYLAELTRARRELLPRFQQLLEIQHEQAPTVMRAYSDVVLAEQGVTSIWFNFDRALQQHTQAWQKIFRQCGLMPTESDVRPIAE